MVADASIERWIKFVNTTYTPEGTIESVWSRHMFENLPDASEEEKGLS